MEAQSTTNSKFQQYVRKFSFITAELGILKLVSEYNKDQIVLERLPQYQCNIFSLKCELQANIQLSSQDRFAIVPKEAHMISQGKMSQKKRKKEMGRLHMCEEAEIKL